MAELQATTSSLIRRAISSSAICSENASSSGGVRSPYGNRAASAKYTKSSWGSWTSSSCSTVSPPTPESNTPTGRRRSSSGASAGVGTADTRPVCHATPAQPPPARPRSAAPVGRARLSRRRRRPSIAALSFLTTASAMPVSEKLPLAFTTPAIRTAISSTSPTYSTVPCPRSRGRSERRMRPAHQLVDHRDLRPSRAFPRGVRGRDPLSGRRRNGSTRICDGSARASCRDRA